MIWYCKAFEELDTTTLYNLLSLRQRVFVIEQNCVYLDVDNLDQNCLHLWAEIDDEIVAYCRLLPQNLYYEEASIGRVIVSPKKRNLHLGKKMLFLAFEIIQNKFKTETIKIEAQYYLEKYYASLGFVSTGNVFILDGIEHIKMLRKTN